MEELEPQTLEKTNREKAKEQKDKIKKGLKSLRVNPKDPTPQYDCPNCKCKRYSTCGCMKKGE